MPGWVQCGADIEVGHVIRWKEAIWRERLRPTRRKKKGNINDKRGDRVVIGQVLEIDAKGYLHVSVIKDEIVSNTFGMPLKALKKGDVVVRTKATFARGKAERRKMAHEVTEPGKGGSKFLR